jgi:hypothetical protein
LKRKKEDERTPFISFLPGRKGAKRERGIKSSERKRSNFSLWRPVFSTHPLFAFFSFLSYLLPFFSSCMVAIEAKCLCFISDI